MRSLYWKREVQGRRQRLEALAADYYGSGNARCGTRGLGTADRSGVAVYHSRTDTFKPGIPLGQKNLAMAEKSPAEKILPGLKPSSSSSRPRTRLLEQTATD